MYDSIRLNTERLTLTALTTEALQAWADGDAAALLELTGARFDEPVKAPPLFDEDLPTFVERMREAPDELGWWVWLMTRSGDARAVGVCGLSGRHPAGATMVGYSIYPAYEGRGYATEGSGAVVDWALSQPGMRKVEATVPVGHSASIRVAEKLGMEEVGRDHDDEVGEIAVYAITRL